ncbi:hypothetical protein [Radiobacillus deserti]|uniref:hypothetical protein n=1 Tax=Radiobacillus deserti TaxID=2594883 RepID=UPI0013150DCF|nr:hypothetical protein [Radiobacillus deserti]
MKKVVWLVLIMTFCVCVVFISIFQQEERTSANEDLEEQDQTLLQEKWSNVLDHAKGK